MIHFGRLITSSFGNKIKMQVILFLLILSLIFTIISCGGVSYTFNFSLEELKNDLESIEVVSILSEETPLVCETLYLIENEQEREEILYILSEIEYVGINTPQSSESKYGFKLSYSDKCIIISLFRIYITDKELYCHGGTKDGNYHELYVLHDELVSLLGRYVSLEGLVIGWEK